MPAYTFPATANVVALAGLKPVLVDVDPETMNIDPARIESGRGRSCCSACTSSGGRLRLHELPDAAAARGRRGRARRALPRPRLRRSRHRGLPQLPSAQDRHDGRGRRDHDLRRRVRRRGARGCAITAGARSPPPTCRRPGSTTGSRTFSARSASRRLRRLDELFAARTRDRRGLRRASRPPARAAAATRTRATSTAGRPTCSRSTTATACSPRCAPRGSRPRSAPIALHLLGAYRDQGEFPGARRVLRAGARAALPHPAHGGRPRSGGRGS